MPVDLNAVMARAECIHDQAAVEKAMDQMATDMRAVLADANPIFLCVVVGAIIPMGQLMTRLGFHCEINYIHASRYRGQQQGSDLQWLAKPTCDLNGRTVVLFDDILDRGLTLSTLIEHCQSEGAAKVLTAVLVDKEVERAPGGVQKADFEGLKVPNEYVFGYGLDFHEHLRHVPGIYKIHDQDKA